MTLIKLFCEFFLGHVNFCSGWYNSLIHLPEGQVLKKNFGKDCMHVHKETVFLFYGKFAVFQTRKFFFI